MKKRKLRHRKRRQKSSNTKGSKSSSNKLNRLIDKLVEENFCSAPEHQETRIEKYLQKDLGLQGTALDPDTLWSAVEESGHRDVVGKAASLRLPAFACAMGICEYVNSSKERLKLHIPVLAKMVGMKLNGKFKVEIAALRCVFNYGDDDRRLWSDDSQAMQWLKRNKVTPLELKDWQDENGGSPYSWARDEQKARKEERAANGETVKPEKPTAAQALTGLRKKLGDGERGALLVKREGKVLVSVGSCGLPELPKGVKYMPLIKKAFANVKVTKAKSKKT